MDIYNLYWLHLPGHMDIFTEGYVGITKNPKYRLKQHKTYTKNQHLKNAFIKYGDQIQFDIIIENHTIDYCKQIEEELRQEKNIGWNIAKGGGIPPNVKGIKRTGTKTAWNKGIKKTEKFQYTEEEKYIKYSSRRGKRGPTGKQKNPKQKGYKVKSYKKRVPLSEETKQKMRGKRGPQKNPHRNKQINIQTN